MKTQTLALRSVFLICLVVSAVSAQTQFTHTVTAQTKNCNATCSVFEIQELNNNPGAIVFITPITGSTSNPHPIAAYYMYLSKWSVFNMDGVALPDGAKFNVEYFLNADPSHFVYVVPQRVHPNDLAYIDHAGLNNNPNAQIRILPHTSATVGNIYNRFDLKTEYDASVSKWFVANVNGNPVPSSSAYNVMFSSGISATNPNANKDIKQPPLSPVGTCTCVIPTSLPPSGNAGADLGGTYPNPKVVGLQGKPISSNSPTVGQTLRWNGSEWIPTSEPTPVPPEPVANPAGSKPSVVYFNQSGMVNMYDQNVNVMPISGLDNQVITLARSSRVVYQTVIDVHLVILNNLVQSNATGIWLTVEILNSANAVVGFSNSYAWLAQSVPQSIHTTGLGILPAGTYHTRVRFNRQPGGGPLDVAMGNIMSPHNQGGQMIIEIFPD